MKVINKYYSHLLAVIGFVIVSLIYFYPVLQGKEIYQSDIVQYTGMAKEQNDFRAQENQEPFWTNSSFGGMPTYQLGAKYPNDFIGELDDAIRFLPRPADYLFLYFIGFYLLLIAFKVDPLKSFIGALAFGFSTYLIIILGVGHNAKAHAIGYMPMVVAGVVLVFKRKYWLGGILSTLAIALEINANHFQMTYYLLFLLLFIAIYFFYVDFKNKDFKAIGKAISIFIGALILAIGSNATNLMATAEYADFSIRGKSELTFKADGSPNTTKSAMEYDYITEYSYGIAESFNLLAPRLFGGSNSEKLGSESHIYEFISQKGANATEAQNFTNDYGATYWGDQPIVEAPAYIGAIVFFLFVLAMFIEKRKIKYAFFAGALLTLLLSWGKNFSVLTIFFIDFVPFYDKFRAVSSIQVIVELCLPLLAILGLFSFFKSEKSEQIRSLKLASYVTLGILAMLFVAKGLFDFSGPIDQRLLQVFAQVGDPTFGDQFMDALIADRKSLYTADLLRSGFLIIATIAILYFAQASKIKENIAVISIGVLMVGDLYFINRNYVDESSFVNASKMREPFQATPIDEFILQDTTHFRVYEVNGRLQARTSYFHNSLSGYSAVRPRRIEQLFEYQIDNGNFEVLHMLNTKYVIQTDEQGREIPAENTDANGNAWFVSKIKEVNSADEEMKSLTNFDSKNLAILNVKEFKKPLKSSFIKDSLAQIKLIEYKPNYIKYKTQNTSEGFAVFSEIYYPKGWKVLIDGEETSHVRVNYTLRGMEIPAGNHTIEFKFEPQVVKTGSVIVLISSILIAIIIIAGIVLELKRRQKKLA